jgi:Dehydrogenases with different specificities (related to short-chain alcohol dehydrogenases)
MYNPFSLEGKTILVTGASSGIGQATAIECSKMGAHVVITGRNETRLRETFDLLLGNSHLLFAADLNDSSQIQLLIKNLPPLNGVVHNAGVAKNLPFKFIKQEEFDRLMQVNFYAPVFITKELLKLKKIQREGSVVFISSIASFSVGVGDSMYAASKGALNSFAKVIAVELAKQKIRVNCIQPGIIDTNIFNEGVITEEQLKETERKYPLGRFGKPEEIAYAAIYFLSDASCWTTGSGLIIDGGFTLQ